MKKFLLLFLVSLTIFISTNNIVLAQTAKPLELTYPTVPEATTPTTVETPLPHYIKYVFNFFIWITGFIALAVLVYAGFRYLTSAGQPAILADTKNQILAALAGILILLSSWLILTTINPQLTQLEIKPLPTPLPPLPDGVYLCLEETWEIKWAWDMIQEIKKLDPHDQQRKQKIEQLNKYLKKIEENCWRAPISGETPEKLNDKAKMAFVVSSETDPFSATSTLYGAILYEESKFGGRAQVVYALKPGVAGFKITAIKPSSVRVFVQKKPRPNVYVELYELIDFNRANPDKKSKKYTQDVLSVTDYYGVSGYIPLRSDFKKVGSVKVEGDLIVIFFKEEQTGDWSSDAILDMAIDTDATLYDNLMGRWCRETIWKRWKYYPCPQQMVIISAGIY